MKMHRLNESLPVDKSHYLLAVIIEVDAGKPIPAYYHGPTVGYLIEGRSNVFRSLVIYWTDWTTGEVHFEDESKPGEVTKVVAGDVIHLDHETRVIFSTPTKGKSKN